MPRSDELHGNAEGPPVLRARGLTKRFGAFTAVDGIDLEVERGTLHALIGPNGAGKTTLFNLLTGQLQPTEGEIWFDGQRVDSMPVHRRAQLGMARSFQVSSVFPELTVHENVRLAAQAGHRSVRRAAHRAAGSFEAPLETTERVIEEAGLQRVVRVEAGNLSHGLSRRLEIAMAVAGQARLFLLDEPLSGMGVDDLEGVERYLRSLVPERTVLLVEHNMPVTLAIADRVTVLVQGKVLTEGPPREVVNHAGVREAYLGKEAS